jgi:CheY-like chemotaxis protein
MEVRSMLLHDTGYSVEEAYSSTEALQRLQSDETDLLLICHTLLPADSKRLIVMAHAARKLLPVLCLIAREWDGFEDCVNVENSPAALLSALAAATGLPPARSAGQLRVRHG